MLNSKFGRILGQTEEQGLEQPFKYFGQYGVQHESEVTHYMRARYYDAELGRFLKEDPIGFEGGLNVSLYVGGNPIVGIDPSGLSCIGRHCDFGILEAILFNETGVNDESFEDGVQTVSEIGVLASGGVLVGGLVVTTAPATPAIAAAANELMLMGATTEVGMVAIPLMQTGSTMALGTAHLGGAHINQGIRLIREISSHSPNLPPWCGAF